MDFLHLLDPAERTTGRYARLLWRQTSAFVVGGEEFQMRADLFVEPLVGGPTRELRTNPRP